MGEWRWLDEGGANRAALHAAGGAMIAGLGGGNAVAGAVGAGLSSLAAEKLASLGKSVESGVNSGNKDLDEAIGNLAANLAAGGIGAAVAAQGRQLLRTQIGSIDSCILMRRQRFGSRRMEMLLWRSV